MTEDVLNLHSHKVGEFNTQAEDVLTRLTASTPQSRGDSQPTHLISVATLTQEMIEGYEESEVENSGRTVARRFLHEGRHYGFADADYSSFVEFCEGIHQNRCVSAYVSIDSLEDAVFNWIKRRVIGKADEPMWETVAAELRQQITETTVDIPIAELQVQTPFQLGNVVFAPVTEAVIRHWLPGPPPSASPSEKQSYEGWIRSEQIKYQLICFASTTILAEPNHAKTLAYGRIEDMLSFLSLYTPAGVIPDAVFHCAPFGYESVKVQNCFIGDRRGRRMAVHSTVERRSTHLFFGDDFLYAAEEAGLGTIGALYVKEKKTKFERQLMDTLLLFLRHTRATTLSEKVIFIFVALDSFLLRNDNEPIQANIGRRVAFSIGEDAKERKAIAKTIVDAYQIRSDYIHHAKTSAENRIVETLLQIGMRFFLKLVHEADKYKDNLDLIAQLENRAWE